ncbi:cytochrome c oxidase subunit II [Salinispirillum marinum]|uniref:Cytochrome c oxidase subunit 2 n=2 Tax=Saccharospirillaceae TaxID=255527 RepID=A0ABV8BFE7_9GAMM
MLNRLRFRSLTAAMVLIVAGLLSGGAAAEWQVNMTRGVTEISNDVFNLHMLIFIICCIIAVLVFGVMFYAMWAHRKSRGAVAETWHENHKLEVVWTIIPLLILLGMAVPATITLAKIYQDDPQADVTVMIEGYQWRWRYTYLEEEANAPVSFFSSLATPREAVANVVDKPEDYLLEVDNPLYLPTDRSIRFLITANDVIHSWWVPAFAVKKDAVPGIVNTANTFILEEGTYRGMCAELCGRDHAFMPIVVEAVSPEAFDNWMNEQREEALALAELTSKDWTLDELTTRGQQVYNSFCVACHQTNGQGIPGVFPALVGSPKVVGLPEDTIEVLVNGVRGSAMQAFGNQLSDVDLASVATYIRNSWSNSTGDIVAPIDVVNYKAGQ